MKNEQVNLRLEEDLLAGLERVAAEEALDRATVIRRLLKDALKRWQLEHALGGYERGEFSLGRAAEEAGLTHWELMDALRRENVAYPLSAAEVDDRLAKLLHAASDRRGRGAGFQTQLGWLGTNVTTLADVPPRPGGILLVGINPAPISVAAGHYYQGRLGTRLWRRLARLGLLDDAKPGAEDEAFARIGHGLTDLIKRPSKDTSEISSEEALAGVDSLRQKVRDWKPGLLLFAFKRAADAVLPGRFSRPGLGPRFEGVQTFLLSGPYAPAEEARRVDAELQKLASAEGHTVPTSASGSPRADREMLLTRARDRFGVAAVQQYMASARQSQAARALGIDGRRLRDITRRLGTSVKRGDAWDDDAKTAALAELVD